MVASPDFQDFTQGSSRLMQQLVGSPAASSVAGVNTVTLPVPDFARSLNLLVTVPANIITLTVVGATTGFTYLNAVPAYDGGIYYLPAMPVVDDQVTITWYQVAATAVSIYAIASDEPISVSLFNPVSPTQATSERLAPFTPVVSAANVGINFNVALDTTTRAIRVTVDNHNNYSFGKVVGNQSAKVYFDGTATNTQFPTTPIPVDNTADTTVQVQVHNNTPRTANVYVALVNVPDFAGSLSISNPMASNELAPDPKQSQTPNQLPAIFDGAIAISAVQSLVAAVAGRQLRVHAINILQWSSVATEFDLEDTNGNKFLHYHWPAASNSIYVPLFGQLGANGAGLQLHNLLGTVTASLAITLWYSVL